MPRFIKLNEKHVETTSQIIINTDAILKVYTYNHFTKIDLNIITSSEKSNNTQSYELLTLSVSESFEEVEDLLRD